MGLGVIPGYGGTQRLAQLVGKGKAMELVLTAGMISADEAATLGLVNYSVGPEELMNTCLGIAKKMMRNAPTALSAAIKSVIAGYTDSVDGIRWRLSSLAYVLGRKILKRVQRHFLKRGRQNFQENERRSSRSCSGKQQ